MNMARGGRGKRKARLKILKICPEKGLQITSSLRAPLISGYLLYIIQNSANIINNILQSLGQVNMFILLNDFILFAPICCPKSNIIYLKLNLQILFLYFRVWSCLFVSTRLLRRPEILEIRYSLLNWIRKV